MQKLVHMKGGFTRRGWILVEMWNHLLKNVSHGLVLMNGCCKRLDKIGEST